MGDVKTTQSASLSNSFKRKLLGSMGLEPKKFVGDFFSHEIFIFILTVGWNSFIFNDDTFVLMKI